MIKEFLSKVNLNGLVDTCIISNNKVSYKLEDNSLLMYISTNFKLFENEFGLLDITKLCKILTNFNDDFIENENRIIFKSGKSKLSWLKADANILQKYEKSKEEVVKIYEDDYKIELILTTEILDLIKKVIKTGISEYILFFTENNELKVCVGEDYQNKYESTISSVSDTVKINNFYRVRILESILNNIDYDCKMTIKCDDSGLAYPLLFEGKTSTGIDITYLVSPLSS